MLELRTSSNALVSGRLRAARLAALTAVHVVDEDDEAADSNEIGADGGSAAAGMQGGGLPPPAVEAGASGTFQKGYAAVAAALPEELQPLLAGVRLWLGGRLWAIGA